MKLKKVPVQLLIHQNMMILNQAIQVILNSNCISQKLKKQFEKKHGRDQIRNIKKVVIELINKWNFKKIDHYFSSR